MHTIANTVYARPQGHPLRPQRKKALKSATKSFEIEVRIEDPLVHLESTRASVRNVIATELVQCLGSS